MVRVVTLGSTNFVPTSYVRREFSTALVGSVLRATCCSHSPLGKEINIVGVGGR